MKTCKKCGLLKSLDSFYPHRHSCRACTTARNIAYRAAKPEQYTRKSTEWRRWRTFGITQQQYDERLAAQGGVCACCGKDDSPRQLAVDHCHTTNAIRGLLCLKCNTGIGKLGDTLEGVQQAAKYLAPEVYAPFTWCG